MPSGLYHVDRNLDRIHLVREQQGSDLLSSSFPEQETAKAYVFITAVFQRSTMFYGERGYRVAVSESGRLLQNILLSAEAHGVSADPVEQYNERSVEKLIGIDGVDHAVLQVIAFDG
jgi:SagB-type dehydrogenase family enzyme